MFYWSNVSEDLKNSLDTCFTASNLCFGVCVCALFLFSAPPQKLQHADTNTFPIWEAQSHVGSTGGRSRSGSVPAFLHAGDLQVWGGHHPAASRTLADGFSATTFCLPHVEKSFTVGDWKAPKNSFSCFLICLLAWAASPHLWNKRTWSVALYCSSHFPLFPWMLVNTLNSTNGTRIIKTPAETYHDHTYFISFSQQTTLEGDEKQKAWINDREKKKGGLRFLPSPVVEEFYHFVLIHNIAVNQGH